MHAIPSFLGRVNPRGLDELVNGEITPNCLRHPNAGSPVPEEVKGMLVSTWMLLPLTASRHRQL
jgi:hypothetical protein